MYTDLRTIVSILVFAVGSVALPATASEYPLFGGIPQPAAATPHATGNGFMPVVWNSSLRNISPFNTGRRSIPITVNPDNYNINLGYVAVVIGSGSMAGVVADMVFENGVFTLLSALTGAALGGEWYQRGNAAAVINTLHSREEMWVEKASYPGGMPPLGQALAGN
jgi:hypothetical protein